jgi:hypothetical protein
VGQSKGFEENREIEESSSKTIITLYEATWYHVPEDILFIVTTMRTSNLRY